MGNIGWYRDKLPTRDQYRYKTAQPCTTYNWIGSLRLQFVRSVFYFQLGIPQTAVLLTRDEYSLLHLPIFCSSNCSINPYHPQKIAILYISIPIYPFPQVFIGFHILPPQSFLGFCRQSWPPTALPRKWPTGFWAGWRGASTSALSVGRKAAMKRCRGLLRSWVFFFFLEFFFGFTLW